MIGIVTTLATGICANCGNRVRLTKSDLAIESKWVHDANGMDICPEPPPPKAEPVQSTVETVPGIEAVQCEWRLEVNGTTRDWVAVCPRCDRKITRVWSGVDNQQPRGFNPIHVHEVEEKP